MVSTEERLVRLLERCRGERRAGHRAGDRGEGTAAARAGAATARASREAAGAPRRDRGDRRRADEVLRYRQRPRRRSCLPRPRSSRRSCASCAGAADVSGAVGDPWTARHDARPAVGSWPRRPGRRRGGPPPRPHPLRTQGRQGPDPRVPCRVPAALGGAAGAVPWTPTSRRPSSAWPGRPGPARAGWPSRSPMPCGGPSPVSRWAACATRPRSAATAAPTSEPCPAASSRRSRRPAWTTRSSCSTRSTRSRATGAATRRRRSWRSSTLPTTRVPRHLSGVRLRPQQGVLHRHRKRRRRHPATLYDRLEVIHLTGYTQAEKLAIARRHLVPRVAANRSARATTCGSAAALKGDRPRLHA